MPFKGVTFSGQNVTPKNDGGLYQAHYGDGILWGCSMAISGDDLVIQSGEFIMGGRVVFVDGATNVDLSGRLNNTGYIQVIMNADMSQAEGSQWYTSFVESATTTFPALTQDDINDTDNLYQVELAVIQVSGGNLTSIYRSMVGSGVSFYSVANIYGSNGDRTGKIDNLNWGGGSGILFGSCDNAGTTIGGMAVYQDGQTTFASNSGNPLIFRPNGFGSTSGQVQITSSGQIVGGATFGTATRTSTTSVGSSWTTVVGESGLDASGTYLVVCYCLYTPSSGSGQTIWTRLNGNNGGNYHSHVVGLPYVTQMGLDYVEIVRGETSINYQLNTQSSSLTGTVASGATIRYLRIA